MFGHVILNKYKPLGTALRHVFRSGERRQLHESDVMFFSHDIYRNYDYSFKKYASIVDTINEGFLRKGITTVTIARPYSEMDPTSCFGNVRSVNGMFARAVLQKYILLILKKLTLDLLNIYPECSDVDLWNRILDAVKPRVVIGIEPVKALCIAARKRGVFTIDLQHGVNMDTTGTVAGRYYRLDYRKPKQQGWPDLIACWDASSSMLLNKYRGKFTTAIVLGHPWMDRFFSTIDNDDRLISELESKYGLRSDLPVVLYSLQYTRDAMGRSDSFSPIPKVLDQYIRSEGFKYTWWIRIHPQLLKREHRAKTMKSLSELYSTYNNVNWIEVSEAPLPYVLSKTDLHLTRDSSVVKEAAMFGVKSGLLDEPEKWTDNTGLFDTEINQGIATVLDKYDYRNIKCYIEDTVETRNSLSYRSKANNTQRFVEIIKRSLLEKRPLVASDFRDFDR